jgi:pimeloyl-ACP methyl ester carboxylesterase
MIAAMSAPLHVVRAGRGPRLLFIHGSAADHTTWSIQLASQALREKFELIAYDRRPSATSVEDHAEDAAGLLADGEPAILAGSSFGSVIALELMRTRPALVRGAILIEPPMAASDELAAASTVFLAEFDRRVAEQGGPAAGEFFLRFVLGDAAFDRMPRAFQERAKDKWAEIRADSGALIAYRPRYRELAHVTTPTLLLGGERSASYFRATLDALLAALPNARLEVVPAAGHMLHAEASRKYAEHLIQFAGELQIS